jgi:hypothetical protein
VTSFLAGFIMNVILKYTKADPLNFAPQSSLTFVNPGNSVLTDLAAATGAELGKRPTNLTNPTLGVFNPLWTILQRMWAGDASTLSGCVMGDRLIARDL